MSPPQSHRQLFPTRSIETSPVRKMRRALTTYHSQPKDEEPKTGDENQPLTNRQHENDEGQKQPDDALTLWELLKQAEYDKKPSINDMQASQSKLNLLNKLSTINNELQASQSHLNVWDIELNASGKQDLKSESQVKGPDLEDRNPPLPLRRERTKRDLFKDASDVNFCTWVASRIKKSEHFKLHLKRENIIQEEFDFENYAKRFIGIDVLKYLLLSKDQLMVFDNCVKAYVNLKLDTLTRGSATDDAIFDELRTMFNTKGFPAEAEDAALLRLKEMPDPDEATKKALYLLEVLYERET